MTVAKSSDTVFRDFIHLTVDQAELLGAHVMTGVAMDKALMSRCDDLQRAACRLQLLTAHDTLILLRLSFSAPKLLHTLRSSPYSVHPMLEKFDCLLRSCTCDISNTDLTDTQWLQASLPVEMVAWRSDACHRLHLLPSWRQLWARIVSRIKFC